MEKGWVLLFVGTILFVDVSHSSPTQKDLKAPTTIGVKQKCYLDVLETLHVNCDEVNDDQRSVPHGESCRIKDTNKEPPTVEELVCNDGHWSGTDFTVAESRQKRFWLGFVVGVVVGSIIGGLTVCIFVCHSHEKPKAEIYYPPKFPDDCKPKEIESKYYVEPGEDSIAIDWTEPTATDENGDTPRVRLTQGKKSGEEFTGSVAGKTYYIRYEAIDGQGLTDYCIFYFSVYVRTCDPPVWPKNGYIRCDNHEIGSQCQYSCKAGYKLTGDNIVRCLTTLKWSDTPLCEGVSCGPPDPLSNGTVSCSDKSYSYRSVCSKSCDKGYDLQGQSITQCQADGSWTSFKTTTCIDNSPPTLSCKSPQVFYADRSKHSTSVAWEVPTATDRTDPNPNIVKTSGPSMNDILNVGSEYVTYLAIDVDNMASPECTIELQVKDIICEHPKATLRDKFLDFDCSDALYTYGVNCNISCLANLPLNGTDLITCERNETNGVWSWGNSYMPFCRKISCPDLNPPINGALLYDSVQTRPAVTMMCNDQFDIPDIGREDFTGIFLCLDKQGWTPIDYVPDCIEDVNPNYLSLPGEIYYYSGDCGNNETQEQIRMDYEEILASNYMLKSVCPEEETCTIADIIVECGPIQNRRKRSIKHSANKNAAIKVEKRKRSFDAAMMSTKEGSAHDLVKRQTESHQLVVNFKIVMNITILNNETLRSKMRYYDTIMNDLSGAVQTLLNNGSLDIDNFTTDVHSWKPPKYSSIECSSGYILKKTVCKPCPSGHFLNETSRSCMKCPVGQYYGGEGSTDCTKCPNGYTTKQTGSQSIKNCTALCHPGYASPDGMLPCAVCLYGEYQDEYGQTSCKQCPSGTTTKNTNSTSSQDCHGYDVLIQETGGPVSLAYLSSNINDVSLTFWVKSYDEKAILTTLQLKNQGNDAAILYLTENVKIQIPNQIDETVAELSSAIWTNVVVILSSSDNSVKVFINGNQVYTSSVSVSAPIIANGELILTASGSSGIYMTGLHLFDKAINTTEIALHSSSCYVIESGEVVDMGVFQNIDTTTIALISSSSCNADDNCDPDPCNGHQCINVDSTFKCHCSSGWSGDNCTVPPDYCKDNSCENGATCVNHKTNYTCDCLPGYTGSMCEVPPVDGGWSEWTVISPCNKICGSGNQNRTRSCDSPPPDAYGDYCVGESEDTIPCNTQACLVCDDLVLKIGTQTNCTTDEDTGDQLCTVYCQVGKIMQPGYPDTVDYICGPSTLYKWNATELMPSCVEPSAPTSLSISTSVQFNSGVKDVDKPALIKSIKENFKSTPCSNKCQVNVNISDAGAATISYSVDLTEGPDLDFSSSVSSGQLSPSLQELVDSINSLELTAQHLENNTSDMFDTYVDGETYTVDESSLRNIGVVHCPDGQVSNQGVCVYCPAGTYSDGTYCTFCEKGSYQPEEGQFFCLQCSAGLTTVTVGSIDISECLVYCPAGSYSHGHNCVFCEEGSYQPSEGQSFCIQCPTGLTTVAVGSTDISDCAGATTGSPLSPDKSGKSITVPIIIAVVTAIVALIIACVAIGIILYKKYLNPSRVKDSTNALNNVSVIHLNGESVPATPPSYQTIVSSPGYIKHH
ncbi:Sushi [Mactra antiquata]